MKPYITILAGLCLALLADFPSYARDWYDIGNPVLTDIWVDPANGINSNSGASRATAVKTITEAWNRIPSGSPLNSTGYRVNLVTGTYPCEPGPEAINCQNYFDNRIGTYQYPVIIRAVDGPGTATVRGGFNLKGVSYLYLMDLALRGGIPLPVNSSGNNLLHLEAGEHVLLRNLTLAGPDCDNDSCNNLQEVLKVNQSRYLYVEGCDIGGAWHTSVDYMVVQYGHFMNNSVHTAGQWGMYTKGGTSYLRIEGNEFHHSQLGFEAGQSANFAVMLSPWLHYDVYDIKFVNNVLHDIPGVAMSVSGGYNVLLAYNTLYRVGIATDNGYPLLYGVHAGRGCNATDELRKPVPVCKRYIADGGWGPDFLTESVDVVPNRNVYIYNNLFYNPSPTRTMYSHFGIQGPLAPHTGFIHFPNPSAADNNLVIRGNMIWNGPSDLPLGVEETNQGCQPSNPTCNALQLRADNAINATEPQLTNPGNGNFRPVTGGTVFSSVTYPIPDFVWTDAPASPPVPGGMVSNLVPVDRDGNVRTTTGPPGAYAMTNPSCVVSLDSGTPTHGNSASFPFSGGNGIINVTASNGCGWNAASTSSWLTITPHASGNGNGTVNYQVGVNSMTVSRIGIITIGGLIFTVEQAGRSPIILSSLNGGEIVDVGVERPITWTSADGVTGYLKIELLKDGKPYKVLSSKTPIQAGSFDWSVSTATPPGNGYRIRLTVTGKNGYSVTSNSDFTILNPINLTDPNGKVTVQPGVPRAITWSYTGNPGGYVKIDLLKKGKVYKTLAPRTTLGSGGNGSFNWSVSAKLLPGTDYRIRITAVVNKLYTDVGDSDFTIPNPITLVSPNGGENAWRGMVRTITWSYTGNPGKHVKIELLWNGKTYKTISSRVAVGSGGSGSYGWSVSPKLPVGSRYRIRVTVTDNHGYTDMSDGDFSLL